jgi:hypothetical protein
MPWLPAGGLVLLVLVLVEMGTMVVVMVVAVDHRPWAPWRRIVR